MSDFGFRLLGRRVLCAVSGGADSVYLLLRCLEGARERGYTVAAAHYNHCLRGEESERDERFVRDLCARLGVELSAGRGDVAARAADGGLCIEEAAREMRYAFLERAADALGCDTIATAHNADDNAETMLFALARGAGPKGLAGIPPRRGRIVRPMLGVTRAEIEAYLAGRGEAYVVDSTNASLDYSRNRLRALVMPVMRGLNPRFSEAAGRSGALLRADEEFLCSLAEEFLAAYPDGRVSCAALAAQPWSVASRAVRLMAPGALERGHVEAVLGIARAGAGSADVPGARFCAGGGALFLARSGASELPERELAVPGVTPVPEAGVALVAEAVEGPGEINTSLNTFFFQYENICGRIYCTSRRPGDRLRIAGRGCTKKLADLLYERGVPAQERGLVPVLRDDLGALAAVGVGQDERALARPGSRAIAVRISPLREE